MQKKKKKKTALCKMSVTLIVFDYKVPVNTVVPLLWILKLPGVNDVISGFSVQEA